MNKKNKTNNMNEMNFLPHQEKRVFSSLLSKLKLLKEDLSKMFKILQEQKNSKDLSLHNLIEESLNSKVPSNDKITPDIYFSKIEGNITSLISEINSLIEKASNLNNTKEFFEWLNDYTNLVSHLQDIKYIFEVSYRPIWVTRDEKTNKLKTNTPDLTIIYFPYSFRIEAIERLSKSSLETIDKYFEHKNIEEEKRKTIDKEISLLKWEKRNQIRTIIMTVVLSFGINFSYDKLFNKAFKQNPTVSEVKKKEITTKTKKKKAIESTGINIKKK